MPHTKHYKEDEYVLCPFYKNEGAIEIRCEGIVSLITSSIFASSAAKDEHKKEFCIGLYRSCPIYQELEKNLL